MSPMTPPRSRYERRVAAHGRRWAPRTLALAVFFGLLGIDLATKAWAGAYLMSPVCIADWLCLMFKQNSGVFFGTVPITPMFWVVLGAALGWFGWRAVRSTNASVAVCLAAVLAGLTGNAIGQAQGAIVDFIGFGPISGDKWLVANVADFALVVGALALGFFLVRERLRRRPGTFSPSLR